MALLLMPGTVAVATFAAMATSTPASASLSGTRYEAREMSHVLDVRIDRGHATIVVERTIENAGPRSDQATFFIDLPSGAVATGLRSMGALPNGEHVWFTGELMEAEAAAAKYKELTGIGGYYPKDPALLSWRSQQLLALQVFPVLARGLKTIEYTLEVPTTYRDGRHHLVLPAGDHGGAVIAVMLSAVRPGDAIFVDGRPATPGARVSLVSEIDVALAPHAPPSLATSLAVVPFASKRNLVRSRIDASGQLSTVPRGAHVVVLLDTSRSMSDAAVEAEVAAARSYLSWFDDAKVAVMSFDRKPHPRQSGFVSAAEARADLARANFARRNGSHIDAALAKADTLLAEVSRDRARRIVVMTDLRTRDELTPERVRARVATSGAVVHLATIASGNPSLTRDDDAPWASVPRATGGVLWSASASPDADGAAMRSVYEEWVRPLRIDRFRVTADGLAADAFNSPTRLDEGEGFEDTRIVAEEVTGLVAAGELWSTAVRVATAPSATEAKLWSALVFGSSVLGELDEKEMMVLARRGGAVSPVTSYLAIEPGVRPSTEGLDWGSGGGFGFGHGRLSGSHRSCGLSLTMPDTFDYVGFLRDAIAPQWAACGGGSAPASVRVETTSGEIVDARATIAGSTDARVRRCLEEAAWSVSLSSEFEKKHHQRWTVSLAGP